MAGPRKSPGLAADLDEGDSADGLDFEEVGLVFLIAQQPVASLGRLRAGDVGLRQTGRDV